jgi:peptidoglycan/xylan/chitin deacetylase (PgdA/CDA1 family)
MTTDAFWGLPPSGSVVPSQGAVVGRWEVIAVPLNGAPARITLPERRTVAPGDPIVSGRLESGEEVALAVRRGDGHVELAFDVDEAVAALIRRRAYTRARPLSARLPFRYRRVPTPLRNLVRNLLSRRAAARLGEGYPAWPIDPSVEMLRRIYLTARRAVELALEPTPFWPDGKHFALALTHDVDSGPGLQLAREIASEEAAQGHRSCWYLVGGDYRLDPAAIGDLRDAGGELGLHGSHHDNRIAFLEDGRAEAELDACRATIDRLGMRGFRSPSMLRTPRLYAALEGRFQYDSSMPDTGLLPERNGCGTVFPFAHGSLTVLPLTLPPDGQLLGRGLGPAQVLAAWIDKAEWVAGVQGAAVHLTHPEPGFSAEPAMRETYRAFMGWVSSRDDVWAATSAEIVDHWTTR